MTISRTHGRRHRRWNTDDLEVLLVKYSNGAMGKISVNYGCIMPYTFPVEVFGTRGTIKDNKVWSHKYPGQKNWAEIPTIAPESADVSHHPFPGADEPLCGLHPQRPGVAL